MNVKIFRRLRRRGVSIRDAERWGKLGIDPKPSWRQRHRQQVNEMSRVAMAKMRARRILEQKESA